MVRIAIPIFMKRISPILDDCTRLLITRTDQKRALDQEELFLDQFTVTERCRLMKRAGVDVIICCGVSDVMYNLLAANHIKTISGIIGKVDQVLAAFLDGSINDPAFQIPACRKDRYGRVKRSPKPG